MNSSSGNASSAPLKGKLKLEKESDEIMASDISGPGPN